MSRVRDGGFRPSSAETGMNFGAESGSLASLRTGGPKAAWASAVQRVTRKSSPHCSNLADTPSSARVSAIAQRFSLSGRPSIQSPTYAKEQKLPKTGSTPVTRTSIVESSQASFATTPSNPEVADQSRFVCRYESRLEPFAKRLVTHMLSTSFSDVTLSVEGIDFPCHRLVLACSSEYFAQMFEKPSTENGKPCIMLPGKTSSAVRSVLRLMYFDATLAEVVRGDVRHLVEVLDIAVEWRLHDVMEDVVTYTNNNIHDVEDLKYMCLNLYYNQETKELQQTCQDRLRAINQDVAARRDERRRGEILCSAGGVDPTVESGRWPTLRHENWSMAVKSPRFSDW